MGRPRKRIDMELVRKLHSQGLPSRGIAKALKGISYKTIQRVLSQDFTDVANDVGQNPGTIQPESSDVANVLDQNQRRSIATTITPVPLAPLGQLHKCLFVFEFDGKQPISDNYHKFGNKLTQEEHRFDVDNAVFLFNKYKVKVYVRDVSASTTGILLDKARGYARKTLGKFAMDHGLKIKWPINPPRDVLGFDINLTNEHKATDEALCQVIRQKPGKAKELGMVAGDSSHPDQAEFIGFTGQDSFDRFSFLLKNAPEFIQSFKLYDEQIRKHLGVIEKLNTLLEKMNERLGMMK